jgi:hypothetical protein
MDRRTPRRCERRSFYVLNDSQRAISMESKRPSLGKAVQSVVISSAPIDDGLVVVPVAISIMVLLDDDSIPIPMFVAIADDGAVVISIAVAVMSGADGDADRSDTNANFFRARRHRGTQAGNGSNYQSIFHCILRYCEAMGFNGST